MRSRPTAAGRLAELIRDYSPPSSAAPAQRAAYPFTRLRADGIWTLDHDVPMDRVQPLATGQVVGQLTSALENALRDPDIAAGAARRLVDAEFPTTIAPDVLMAVGLDPDTILTTTHQAGKPRQRQRSWTASTLTAWNRQCAFCGYDGQLGAATVGVDNGLALCPCTTDCSTTAHSDAPAPPHPPPYTSTGTPAKSSKAQPSPPNAATSAVVAGLAEYGQ